MFGDPITNQRGWRLDSLANVGSLERGISTHRPRNDPDLLGGAYPLIQTGDVANSDGYIRRYKTTYSEKGLAQSRLWPSGTLCITIAANIAKTGILKFDACFPDSVVGFTAAPAIIQYVNTWFRFQQKILENTAPEFAQKNINLSILRKLSLPLPPLNLIETFAERAIAVKGLKEVQRSQEAELDALFAALQDRAFAGRL